MKILEKKWLKLIKMLEKIWEIIKITNNTIIKLFYVTKWYMYNTWKHI